MLDRAIFTIFLIYRVSLQSSHPNFQKNFVSPKMAVIFNFRIFHHNWKTQKCLYLKNHARQSNFDEIIEPQGISAEYPCQFSNKFCFAKNEGRFGFCAEIAKHKNAYILKTVLDRADYADFVCHNSIRLGAEHFLTTLALPFISFLGRFVFAMQKHYLFFASDPLVTPQPLRAVGVLFSPMVSGQAGGRKKFVRAISQKP